LKIILSYFKNHEEQSDAGKGQKKKEAEVTRN